MKTIADGLARIAVELTCDRCRASVLSDSPSCPLYYRHGRSVPRGTLAPSPVNPAPVAA